MIKTLSAQLLHRIEAYWRAVNYLSVGQIYLYDNPLAKRPRCCMTRSGMARCLCGGAG